jgi:hypothetical protein
MNKKAFIWGGLFGLIAPFIGIFLGLQVSTLLGNIFAFPLIGIAYMTGQPFGMWHPALMIGAAILSIVVWALIFGIIARLFRRVR